MDISRNCIKFIVIILLGHLISCSHKNIQQPKKLDYTKVERKISSIPEETSNKSVKLYLPLSGPHQNIGHSMLKAVMMAMYDSGSNYQIDPIDTLSSNFSASLSTNEETSKDYKIILGPLYYGDTKLVQPYAKSLNIQMLSFSNNVQLAESDVFVVGVTPDLQLRAIISFATEAETIENYFLLIPKNQFGESLLQAIKKLEAEYSNIIFKTYIYSDLQNLEEQFYHLANDLHNAPGNANAVIFPEGGDSLKVFASLYGKIVQTTDKTKLFGFDTWLDNNVSSNSSLSDAYIVSKKDREYEVFVSRYNKLNNSMPNFLAYQAYCAARIIFKLLDEKDNISRDDILHSNSPWLHFDHRGIARYNLQVIKLRNAKK